MERWGYFILQIGGFSGDVEGYCKSINGVWCEVIVQPCISQPGTMSYHTLADQVLNSFPNEGSLCYVFGMKSPDTLMPAADGKGGRVGANVI